MYKKMINVRARDSSRFMIIDTSLIDKTETSLKS